MGTFRTSCTVANIANRGLTAEVPGLLVDTGSEFTWLPETVLESLEILREKKDQPFLMANGRQITRNLGFAILYVEDYVTIDEVVFAQEGDLLLLGTRTLEGLNLMVDPARRKLVAAGPLPAAAGR